ncbi:MAG: hydantoinase/oxoprolinase N-terminal domain-containing protein [Granulosicoccus sp.]
MLASPDDLPRAIADAVSQCLTKAATQPSSLSSIALGNTVATPALIKQRGVKTALMAV